MGGLLASHLEQWRLLMIPRPTDKRRLQLLADKLLGLELLRIDPPRRRQRTSPRTLRPEQQLK